MPWEWEKNQQNAFGNLKEQLYENAVLNYFDINLKTEVICDASPVGLSAIWFNTKRRTRFTRNDQRLFRTAVDR